jgi:acyl-CoA thioesterase I
MIEVVRKLSKQYNTILIPLNDIFAKASTVKEPSYWSLDGVHPTMTGHALIAQSWIKCIFDFCEITKETGH